MSGVVKAIGSIFAPKTVQPATPTIARMPDPQDPAALLAARKKIDAKRQNGRAGTIYTNGSGSYGNSNLGGTA